MKIPQLNNHLLCFFLKLNPTFLKDHPITSQKDSLIAITLPNLIEYQ